MTEKQQLPNQLRTVSDMEVIKIGRTEIKVEANASTLIIYEDRFKGRRLLQDIDELAKIDTVKTPFSLYAKLLWATAKTADDSIADLYEWTKQYSISEIITASQYAVEMILKSIQTTKKAKAAVKHSHILRLMKFLHMR